MGMRLERPISPAETIFPGKVHSHLDESPEKLPF